MVTIQHSLQSKLALYIHTHYPNIIRPWNSNHSTYKSMLRLTSTKNHGNDSMVQCRLQRNQLLNLAVDTAAFKGVLPKMATWVISNIEPPKLVVVEVSSALVPIFSCESYQAWCLPALSYRNRQIWLPLVCALKTQQVCLRRRLCLQWSVGEHCHYILVESEIWPTMVLAWANWTAQAAHLQKSP